MRKIALSLFVALLGLLPTIVPASTVRVPEAHNLQQVAGASVQRKLPILLVFTATDCGYCKVLEREILRPMVLSGDYTDKVIMRKVVVDDPSAIVDLNGKKVSGAELASRYKVSVTPTMVLVDAHGHELVKRITGVGELDYFGAEVDAAIDQARGRLRAVAISEAARPAAGL